MEVDGPLDDDVLLQTGAELLFHDEFLEALNEVLPLDTGKYQNRHPSVPKRPVFGHVPRDSPDRDMFSSVRVPVVNLVDS